jgi:hypothetical protein
MLRPFDPAPEQPDAASRVARGGPPSATRLSRREHASTRAGAISSEKRTVARSSLLSACAMLACSLVAASGSGCLVTPTPEFREPDQTPPYLVAADAKPDLRQPVIVTDLSQTPALTFSASVVSQDRGPIFTELLIDYGFDNAAGQKARYVISAPKVPAGSLDDAPRPVSATWYPVPGGYPVGGGCHTVTLMVSHGFDENGSGCPQRLCDASYLVWQVMLPCGVGETCPSTCPPPTDTCPATLDHGVDPAITCPGDEQDAGVLP